MGTRGTVPILLLCVLGLSSSLSAQTYQLQPATADELWSSDQGMTVSLEPPPDVGPLPDFAGDEAWFAELVLGDGRPMLMAIVALSPTDPRVRAARRASDVDVRRLRLLEAQLVYLDLDRDRDLAEEQPLLAEQEPLPLPSEVDRVVVRLGVPPATTPPVTVEVRYDLDGQQVTRELVFSIKLDLDQSVGYVDAPSPPWGGPYVVQQQYWRGQVKLGDGDVQIALRDRNGDGLITVDHSVYAASALGVHSRGGEPNDRIWIDRNGDAKEDRGEWQYLLRYIWLDGNLYELSPRRDGAALTVAPYEGPLATLALSATDGDGRPVYISEICLSNSELTLTEGDPGMALQLPPGEYDVTYGLARREEEALKWFFGATDPVQLEAGRTTAFRCGGRLAAWPVVRREQRAGQAPLLRFYPRTLWTVGNRHRLYHCGGRRPAIVPALELLNARGEVVATGNAETVPLPEGEPAGTYRVRATWDTSGYQERLVSEVAYTVER